MAMRIEITIKVVSDFHVGTGSGMGRTIDAVALKDENGIPYIPASSLKGLTRWHAEQLAPLLDQQYNSASSSVKADLFAKAKNEIFGTEGMDTGRVFFTDARYQNDTIPYPQAHGRSTRDRISGRALEKQLFHIEDAAAGNFQSVIYSHETISWQTTLLLLMALRRIEALGGQRHRGKGQARVSCQVIEGEPLLKGVELPGHCFETLLRTILKGGPEAVMEHLPTTTSTESVRPDISVPQKVSGQVLLVFARAQSPLTLTDDPERGNVIGSLDFIPGTSIRGALAWHLIHIGWATDQELFQSVFMRDQICFGPLYPSSAWRQQSSLPFPTPRSLLTCKYAPDIWERGKAHARIHGIRDVLRGGNLEKCGYGDGDDRCDAPLLPRGGYIQIVRSGTGQGLQPIQLERLTIQRTEIDDKKLRGEDQKLYTTEAIPAGTWFAGYVWGSPELLSELLQACPVSENNSVLLHIGKSRTRGHGELEVFFRLPDEDRHTNYPLLLPSNHNAALDPTASDGFTLTLYSDTIGIDKWLRPITRVDEETLWALLGGTGPSPLKIVRGYTTTRQIAGFNNVPGVPRTPDVALVAGSTWYVQWCSNSTVTERTDVVKLLQHAVSSGIGLRRGEGFGRIIVNLPLHWIDLDQPRAFRAQLDDIIVDLGLPDPLLPPGTPAPSWPTSVRATLRDLPLSSVHPGSRIGLARLLWQISQSEDVQVKLEAILQERVKRIQRGKEAGGEDALLQKLVDQCEGKDCKTVEKLIEQCVVELVRLDAEERRKGG